MSSESEKESLLCVVRHLMVNVELVVLPGLQRLIKSRVALDRSIGQNGAPAQQRLAFQHQGALMSHRAALGTTERS